MFNKVVAYKCSQCGEVGHNTRTCRKTKTKRKELIPVVNKERTNDIAKLKKYQRLANLTGSKLKRDKNGEYFIRVKEIKATASETLVVETHIFAEDAEEQLRLGAGTVSFADAALCVTKKTFYKTTKSQYLLASFLGLKRFLKKTVYYLKDGVSHNEHGPAVEYADGTKEWRVNGEPHRLDGPATEYADGTKEWRVNGQLHREDGPAIEKADGTKEWWVNGKRHREDGPAIEKADGTKEWRVNGELHRTDGPAVEYADGAKEWWVNGELHRLDGPAVEYADGHKTWWLDGELHRLDGPAVEWADGNKEWRVNGQLHRLDGPALELTDGHREWWVDGISTNHPHLCEKATLLNLTREEFYTLCTHNDYVVRNLATHNPNCPKEYKVLVKLLNK